jgi:tRNA dimethylallyltransferase
MQSQDNRKPIIVIVGPTGVGKTQISISLAERLSGEVVSADSRLFYRGMDIGTAKPTVDERMRVTHHLIDVADPDEIWSLAKYQQTVYQAIGGILRRGCLPFLVGGTGQYIRAVTEGWDIPKVKPDHHLRAVLQKWADEIGYQDLHNRLAVLDPSAAEKIEPKNVRRSIRALEVIFSTGKPFSDQRRRSGSPYHPLILGLTRPRPELYKRVDDRIQEMLEEGFVDEVQDLLDQGYPPDLPPFSAIGYRQIIDHLQGFISLEEAIILIKRLTRQYVRRQSNWFKRDDPNIHWFQVFPDLVDEMEAFIVRFLQSKTSN